ncbi:LysR family transcriptional regulator [Stenotrophomonas sp. BIGb0135]|jgi:DNA-binding transcriptional LysR family regulator|uniref:LysR family transcriptional regulator n=1 Tax=Stenotrophomonas nematodicola TaxID=2656746 RepID=A0ABW7CZY3_9GAMM|nr:LysR family transcriptional regulator [Stenotrophomonas sp. BIGb0135]MCS4236852.1 DNA-binding transcriptional LysR family regulator [Stenotrophomonas sp. BIGb0135]
MSAVKTHDLQAFLVVAQEQSFTKAAVRLGVTPSALSHSMRLLEERLGIRLLARTTRNVSPTEAGERLMRSIAPHFEAIGASVEALGDLRDRPAGTLRISCTDDSMQTIIRPRLAGFLAEYPDITLELYVDYGFINVVEQRFDAGIRLGEALSKDMIGVRVGPDWRLVVVGSPGYFEKHPKPRKPADITQHRCVHIRHRPTGAIYAWEFEEKGKEFTVRGDGPLVFNSMTHVINAALDGLGLAYAPEPMVAEYIAQGRLVAVLDKWCVPFPGYHLYYPNRRQPSPAFSALVAWLKRDE